MWDDIKGILGTTINIIFWMIILSFCFGYTLGNYYGMRETIDNPRVFQFKTSPGYFILSIDGHPEMKKYK